MKTSAHNLLAITALTLATAAATPESIPQDDAGLADFIGMTFSADDRLSGEGIRVSIANGIATLTGRVATLDQAERAVDRAKSVDGVRAVLSRLKITPARTGDRALTDEIARRLNASPGLDARHVTISVTGTTATLTGTTSTWDEQEIAREITSEVPGIAVIFNQINSPDTGTRSDQAIRWQIKHAIANDPLNDGLDIKVTVSGGNVLLSGETGTPGEKALLAHRARVTGVTTVSTSGLHVVRSLSMEGMTGKTPGPNTVQDTVQTALAADARLRGTTITPRFDGRLLTLTGRVSDSAAKAAAESTARGVPGVGIILNRLTIDDDRRMASN